MSKIMLLATGGTIASKKTESGLSPEIKSGEILHFLNETYPQHEIETEDILNMDSSNIQPEQWQLIAKRVYNLYDSYDGFIITHGTDTMAYTAAAISFMLQNVSKSIVLTGSQLPIENPLTDAKTNLYTAVSAIENNIRGVSVAFDRKIIKGTRAVKTSTMGFDAFESVNYPYMAEVFADKMRIYSRGQNYAESELKFTDKLSTDIFLLKLIPGTKPSFFDTLMSCGYKGLVIEAFGAGGIHYLHRDLLDKLEKLIKNGLVIVVCSQCLYEKSDLSIYEIGRKIMSKGVISGLDMTTEAIVTKLMWAFGQTDDPLIVKKIFEKSITGEIDL